MAFMRHNNNGRRHNNNHNRHRHNNQGNNGQQNGQRRHVNRINQVFESNGPDGRVRGTAQQIVEKYATLARDANVSGDKVLSLNYLQHAEHYQRLLNEIMEENALFERDREAQRAASQAQPELSAEEAEAGFVETQVEGDEQPRDQREPRGDRPQRPDRQDRQERRFDNRGPRPQRQPRPQDDNSDDLNTLPGFLQVPITEGTPAEAAAGPVVETTKTRTPRARKVANGAPETEVAE